MGGLGNQLFQYAFGLSIRETLKQKLYFDISFYDSQEKRSMSLQKIGLDLDIASKIHSKKAGSPYSLVNKAIIKLHLSESLLPGLHLEETPFSYLDYSGLENQKNHYFSGYWQNQKYIDSVLESLRYKFKIANSEKLGKKRALLSKSIYKSCCVHIRRGDYVDDPKTKERHFTCSKLYYETAINRLKLLGIERFYFFSDDVSWTRDNFMHVKNSYFMDQQETEIEDFLTMVCFDNFILSNSTFSWWAAKLSLSENLNHVVYPEFWQTNLKTMDLNLLLSHSNNNVILKS